MSATDCTHCNHGPDDHIDRCFGPPHCAPAVPMNYTGSGLRDPRTKRCECPGYAREANPLAVGTFCECGTRLNVGNNHRPDETRACPMGCEVAS